MGRRRHVLAVALDGRLDEVHRAALIPLPTPRRPGQTVMLAAPSSRNCSDRIRRNPGTPSRPTEAATVRPLETPVCWQPTDRVAEQAPPLRRRPRDRCGVGESAGDVDQLLVRLLGNASDHIGPPCRTARNTRTVSDTPGGRGFHVHGSSSAGSDTSMAELPSTVRGCAAPSSRHPRRRPIRWARHR